MDILFTKTVRVFVREIFSQASVFAVKGAKKVNSAMQSKKIVRSKK